ncbi:hypothetical protein ACFFX0_23565 [Citricoccus parietis]|uniref:Uncharacterized protein n=1 Tax=Citricoccus parietis TaxID=592307 RepID=A0ABV5G6G7_9MICC
MARLRRSPWTASLPSRVSTPSRSAGRTISEPRAAAVRPKDNGWGPNAAATGTGTRQPAECSTTRAASARSCTSALTAAR